MRFAQRGGSVPESKQEVLGYHAHEAGHEIQKMIDKYAVRVVGIFNTTGSTLNEHVVWVIFEEDNSDDK